MHVSTEKNTHKQKDYRLSLRKTHRHKDYRLSLRKTHTDRKIAGYHLRKQTMIQRTQAIPGQNTQLKK